MTRRTRKDYASTMSFLDLLFNILIGIFVLFVLSIRLIQPDNKKNKKSNIEFKAEYVVSMEWPDDVSNDVDLWVSGPNDKMVFYGQRESPYMNLDRDDLGVDPGDTGMEAAGGAGGGRHHWEHVTIRQSIKGRYTVNAHLFSSRSSKSGEESVPVSIRIERLNPYETVFSGVVKLERQGSEVTAASFEIVEGGGFKNVSRDQKHLVGTFSFSGHGAEAGESFEGGGGD